MSPKPLKFNSKDVEMDERSLFIKDFTLAKYVYDATQVTPNFRLVVDGAVLCSKPAGVLAVCPDNAPKLWSSRDMTWDDQGCLVILDDRFRAALQTVFSNAYSFRIDVPLEAVSPGDANGGGIGENKINAMCLC